MFTGAQANFLPVAALGDEIIRGAPLHFEDGSFDAVYGQWLMDHIYTQLVQVGGVRNDASVRMDCNSVCSAIFNF
jgi:hypothetical protein